MISAAKGESLFYSFSFYSFLHLKRCAECRELSVSFCQCVQMADEGFKQTGSVQNSLSLSLFSPYCSLQYTLSPFQFFIKSLFLHHSTIPDSNCHSSKGRRKKKKEKKRREKKKTTLCSSHIRSRPPSPVFTDLLQKLLSILPIRFLEFAKSPFSPFRSEVVHTSLTQRALPKWPLSA